MNISRLESLLENKETSQAEKLLSKLKNSIDKGNYYFYLGVIKQIKNDKLNAIELYNSAIKFNPAHRGAIINLAFLLAETGRYADALRIASEIAPPFDENTLNIKSDILHKAGKIDDALKFLESFDEHQTLQFHSLLKTADIYLDKSEFSESLKAYDRAIRINDKSSKVWGNRAVCLNKMRMFDEAIKSSVNALHLRPKFWKYLLNLSTSFIGLENYEQSEKILNEIDEKDQSNTEVIYNRARTCLGQRNSDRSLVFINKLIEQDRESPRFLALMGDYLNQNLRYDESLRYYDKSIENDPTNSQVIWNRSLVLLRTSNYEAGWKDYDYGFLTPSGGRGLYPYDKKQEWTPASVSTNLLIWAEQGVGDEVMFSKFIKYIPDNVEKIYYLTSERVKNFLQPRWIDDRRINFITSHDSVLYGAQIPIGNLPKWLWKDYEKDEYARKPHLSLLISSRDDKRKRVGISWRGGKKPSWMQRRSIPLGVFRRIRSLFQMNVDIIPLQYNSTAGELDFLSRVFGDRLQKLNYDAMIDLDAWARDIATCDLILSVDNSVVHFAGAMGINTICIIPDDCDFRWGLAEEQIWYESVSIFRGVISKSNDEIADFFNNKIIEIISK